MQTAVCHDTAPGPRPARCALVSPKTPFNLKRTAVEFGTLYGGVVLFYFYDGRVRRIDRGFEEGLKTMSPSRLRWTTSRIPIGGLMYYGFPRANGASARGSFFTLLGASVFWEQVVELQELASINDHIGTAHSGWAIGEALYQARSLFRRGEPTAINRTMSAFLGIPITFTEPIRKRASLERASTYEGSLPTDGRAVQLNAQARLRRLGSIEQRSMRTRTRRSRFATRPITGQHYPAGSPCVRSAIWRSLCTISVERGWERSKTSVWTSSNEDGGCGRARCFSRIRNATRPRRVP